MKSLRESVYWLAIVHCFIHNQWKLALLTFIVCLLANMAESKTWDKTIPGLLKEWGKK